MKMLPDTSLWARTAGREGLLGRFVSDANGTLDLATLPTSAGAAALSGRSVLVTADRQLPVVQALLALDGTARRIVLCPPDLSSAQFDAVLAEAEVDVIVSDGTGHPAIAHPWCPIPDAVPDRRETPTEWVLLTSGTTGQPKLVVHSLASLAGPLDAGPAAAGLVWSTFYDVRRYGGLQVLLRALIGGGSLVLSQRAESVAGFLVRAGKVGVTHVLGTPSHWRQVLMSGRAACLAPLYVRLSGEIADQAILDALKRQYPDAAVVHAFASTEAGVGFEVVDGSAGFPASFVEAGSGKAEIRVVDGSLRLRSSRRADRIIGKAAHTDADGFVDTGDMVERQGDRYLFAGRREGVINVGGQKVYPEEVEAVITRHPDVQVARVYARTSPITGAIAVADLVLKAQAPALEAVRDEVLRLCRDALQPHKVPASIRLVDRIAVAPSGKVARANA